MASGILNLYLYIPNVSLRSGNDIHKQGEHSVSGACLRSRSMEVCTPVQVLSTKTSTWFVHICLPALIGWCRQPITMGQRIKIICDLKGRSYI
jgi:hypothetical protein